jgi:hypothetical protein
MSHKRQSDVAPRAPTAYALFRYALAASAWITILVGCWMESIAVAFSGALVLILSVMLWLDHITSTPAAKTRTWKAPRDGA